MADDEVEAANFPQNMKNLRACLDCRLVKTREQFQDEGCDNCRHLADTGWQLYTTPVFHGLIAMTRPSKSWVAKWQKQSQLAPGMYAVQVVGSLQD